MWPYSSFVPSCEVLGMKNENDSMKISWIFSIFINFNGFLFTEMCIFIYFKSKLMEVEAITWKDYNYVYFIYDKRVGFFSWSVYKSRKNFVSYFCIMIPSHKQIFFHCNVKLIFKCQIFRCMKSYFLL